MRKVEDREWNRRGGCGVAVVLCLCLLLMTGETIPSNRMTWKINSTGPLPVISLWAGHLILLNVSPHTVCQGLVFTIISIFRKWSPRKQLCSPWLDSGRRQGVGANQPLLKQEIQDFFGCQLSLCLTHANKHTRAHTHTERNMFQCDKIPVD